MLLRHLRPMSHLRFYPAILSRDFIAWQLSRSMRLCSCTLRLCRVNKPNQHDCWWYSWCSLVLVSRLAEWKRTINLGVQKRLDMEQFHHFGIVFVKAESGAEAVFVYATKSQCATRQSQRLRLRRAIKSRTRATKSRDKIAGVTSV